MVRGKSKIAKILPILLAFFWSVLYNDRHERSAALARMSVSGAL
jgi:hypothetical protein